MESEAKSGLNCVPGEGGDEWDVGEAVFGHHRRSGHPDDEGVDEGGVGRRHQHRRLRRGSLLREGSLKCRSPIGVKLLQTTGWLPS